MAKELPYFKFEPAEYLTGDISFCSLSAQGFFIVICSYYWQRNCELTKTQLLKRLNKVDEFNELVSENIILLEDETIKIKFLDDQLDDVKKTSKTNSENGKKGGRPRKNKPEVNPQETENKPTALISLSETKGIREDEIRLDEIRKENKRKIEFDLFWDLYDSKKGRKNCFDKFKKLKQSEVDLILAKVKPYVISTPDVKYRKNPLTWLRGEHWNDEITSKKQSYKPQKPTF